MPTVGLFNIEGNKVGDYTLNDNVFNVEVNKAVLHQVVVAQLANKRQGTQSTKTRAEVRGGGAKPWKQKGTGRARQGSIRSPQWKGGGVVFAPKPRDYSYTVPKKVRRLAMKSALTSKIENNEIIIVDDFAMEVPKTREFTGVLRALNAGKKSLVVTSENSPIVVKSGRNIPGVKVSFVNMLNVYDIINSDTMIITRKAIEKVEEVYA